MAGCHLTSFCLPPLSSYHLISIFNVLVMTYDVHKPVVSLTQTWLRCRGAVKLSVIEDVRSFHLDRIRNEKLCHLWQCRKLQWNVYKVTDIFSYQVLDQPRTGGIWRYTEMKWKWGFCVPPSSSPHCLICIIIWNSWHWCKLKSCCGLFDSAILTPSLAQQDSVSESKMWTLPQTSGPTSAQGVVLPTSADCATVMSVESKTNLSHHNQ